MKKDTKRVDKVEKRYYNVSIRYKSKGEQKMKKFEVGKTYTDFIKAQFEVISRTEKTVQLFVKKGDGLLETGKTYRKKICRYHNDYESVYVSDYGIHAISEI